MLNCIDQHRFVAPNKCPGRAVRLPGLKALVNNPPWQTVEMKDWYGRGDYPHVTSATAVWYKTGMPAVPIRWVLIKDPKGKFEPQALYART